MSSIHFNQAKFITSAAQLDQLPEDSGAEVAFVGRSNCGKSSAINAITGVRKLAHKSKTPGRTQLLNSFELGKQQRLVDLPGYGFAKVSDAMKQRWHETLGSYFEQRQSLTGVVIMMDIRHPLTDYDQQMIDFALSVNLPMHILLTKADKLSRNAAKQSLMKVQKSLESLEAHVSIQMFSALKFMGVDEARAQIEAWLRVD